MIPRMCVNDLFPAQMISLFPMRLIAFFVNKLNVKQNGKQSVVTMNLSFTKELQVSTNSYKNHISFIKKTGSFHCMLDFYSLGGCTAPSLPFASACLSMDAQPQLSHFWQPWQWEWGEDRWRASGTHMAVLPGLHVLQRMDKVLESILTVCCSLLENVFLMFWAVRQRNANTHFRAWQASFHKSFLHLPDLQ